MKYKKDIDVKLIVLALLIILLKLAMADVSHNADFPISDLSIEAILEPADSNIYHHIEQIGCLFKTKLLGFPELPYQAINLVIPANEEVIGITIDNTISEELGDTFYVYPAQPPWKIGDPRPPFVPPDSEAYSSNLPYPGNLAEVAHCGYFSGYHLVTVRLYPTQYIPAARKLIFYSKIAFTIHTRACVSKAVPVYRRSPIVQARMEKIVKSLVENPEEVRSRKWEVRSEKIETKPLLITSLPSIEGSGVDYLIITSEALKDTFQVLADWKTRKGVVTAVRTVEWINQNYTGCDLTEEVRNFIKDAYSYWGTIWFLRIC